MWSKRHPVLRRLLTASRPRASRLCPVTSMIFSCQRGSLSTRPIGNSSVTISRRVFRLPMAPTLEGAGDSSFSSPSRIRPHQRPELLLTYLFCRETLHIAPGSILPVRYRDLVHDPADIAAPLFACRMQADDRGIHLQSTAKNHHGAHVRQARRAAESSTMRQTLSESALAYRWVDHRP